MDFILDPSLALYLPFYELDGSSFMSRDHYGHLATVTGALWTPQGRTFDGTDDRIAMANHSSLQFTTALSIAVWMTLGAQIATTQDIISKGQAGAGYFLRRDGNTDTVDGYIVNASTYKKVSITVSTPLVPHLFVFTYDNATLRSYLDGVAGATTSGASALDSGNAELWIGADPIGARWSKATMHEVILYSRALSATEIQHSYLATKWRYS